MLGQDGHVALALMSLLLLLWREAAPIEVPQDRKSLSNHQTYTTQYVTANHNTNAIPKTVAVHLVKGKLAEINGSERVCNWG